MAEPRDPKNRQQEQSAGTLLSLVQESIKRVQKLTEKPDFQENIHDQAMVLITLSRNWGSLTPHEKTRIQESISPRFPRIAESPDPAECFRRIIALPNEEDIYRSLLVKPELYNKWIGVEGEAVYPTTGWLGHYLRYAKHNQIPLAFHFWAAMGVLGAACRRNFYLDCRVFKVYMNHYVILTGPKAAGKSAAASIAMEVLSRLNHRLEDYPEYQVNIFPEDTTQEYLISELSRINSKRVHKTPNSSIVEIRRSDATGILHCDELSNFLGKQTFAVSKKVPFLTTIAFKDTYSKGTLTRDRQNITNLAMSILACSAPEWMRNTIYSDALAGGFMERCLFIHREPVGVRIYPPNSELPPLDPVQAEILAEYLIDLTMPKQDKKVLLLLDKEADDWLGDWYREQRMAYLDRKDEIGEGRVKSLDRLTYQTLRTAAMLSISEGRIPTVGADQMKQAWRIIQAEEVWYEKFLEAATRRPDADTYDEIIRFIRNQGGWCPRWKINRKFRHSIGSSVKIGEYLETLTESNELIVRKEKGTHYGIVQRSE